MLKKLLSIIFCILIPLTALCACKDDTVYGISSGAYVLQSETDTPIKPTVSFNTDDNTFTFHYDPLSSYLSHGSFEVANSKITAHTDDDKYTYIFKIVDNDTVCFVENGSSEIAMTPQDNPPTVTDGAEFKFEN